jgi:hypothetical protein
MHYALAAYLLQQMKTAKKLIIYDMCVLATTYEDNDLYPDLTMSAVACLVQQIGYDKRGHRLFLPTSCLGAEVCAHSERECLNLHGVNLHMTKMTLDEPLYLLFGFFFFFWFFFFFFFFF